ncbi:MAG: hypothetical protein ABH827_04720 [bacterium]
MALVIKITHAILATDTSLFSKSFSANNSQQNNQNNNNQNIIAGCRA